MNFLPGVGEEVGPELFVQPRCAPRGLHRLAVGRAGASTRPPRAAENQQSFVKRVIAEMGGKNAIIVDDDADMDEAVLGITYSTFGYAGQKCSACSRVIVLEAAYDAFVDKLGASNAGLKVGPAELPETTVGPVIDEEALLAYPGIHPARQGIVPRVVAGDVKELEAKAIISRRTSSATSTPRRSSRTRRFLAPSWRSSRSKTWTRHSTWRTIPFTPSPAVFSAAAPPIFGGPGTRCRPATCI